MNHVTLKEGTGKAKIIMRGRNMNVAPPALAQTVNVRVQLLKSDGPDCWEALFDAPALKNDGIIFRDKNPPP